MLYQFSKHAREEMAKRGIGLSEVEAVVQSPEQMVPGDDGCTVYQSKIRGGHLLLRVVIDERVDPARIVTIYQTSRIAKYWRS